MIDITEKKVPHLFRNKYLRNAGSGSVNTSIQSPGQSTPGASVDIVKTDSATVPTDGNVLSALRTLLEIRSRIIASTDTETALSEENTLSSFRIIAEIDAAIAESLKSINELYLSRTKADTAAEAITFLKGLFVGDNLAFINASGEAEVKSLVARMKAKVATLEVTGAASVESITVGKTATTLNLLVQALADVYDLNVAHVATMFRTIIKDSVSSEAFIPGLMGEGMKIYKALNGDWNLEIDNIVVRKVMTIFELVVSKIRSVNGGLVISPANGRIKSIAETTGNPAYYILGIEGDNQFVFDDLVRCQVFTSGQAKYYWVPVASVTADSILVLKSEFIGAVPAIGDDLIQMGNRTNRARQGLLYLTASEDGKPRFSVMDGVNSTSTAGKSKVILGCLDGMTDTDFPADFQPSGYGLYAMNVFLKGVFLLRNGKSVESEIESVKSDAQTAKDKADAITRLFQEFTVAGGLFESKITEVKTYADGRVDGLQVGGRNLIKNSRSLFATGTDFPSYVTHTIEAIDLQQVGKVLRKATGGECYFYGWYLANMSLNAKENTTYVWSLDVRSNCAGNAFFDIRNEYNSQFRTAFQSTNDKWVRITGTMTVTTLPEGDNFSLFLVQVEGENIGDYVYYRNPMIIEGNKSTDWTPAPEDIQDQITANTSAIEVNRQGITLKVSKDELLSTGIDISSRKIVLTSDKVVFQNNSGGQIALFENNKIKADLIDARSIVTGALIAEQIAATNIETGKLTVTNGASVGDFRISGGSLSAEHTPAVIGFIYGNNSASLGAGTLMIDKSNTGNAILVRGGAGFVSMDVNSFEVTSKNGLVVSPHYSNPNGTALAINGKIKTGGKNGQTKSFAISSGWIDGGGAVIDLEVVNGLIVGITWRR